MERKKTMRRAKPYPDLADPRRDAKRYVVSEGTMPQVDRTTRRMEVPFRRGPCKDCGIDHGRAQQIHEMAHAKWSPLYPLKSAARAKVSVESYKVAEDFRIETLVAQRAGLQVDHPLCLSHQIEMLQHFIEAGAWYKAGCILAAGGTRFMHELLNRSDGSDSGLEFVPTWIANAIYRGLEAARANLANAAELARVLDSLRSASEGGDGNGTKTPEIQKSKDGLWYPPRYHEAAMMPSASPKRSAHDEGHTPVNVLRGLLDGRIFNRKTNKQRSERIAIAIDQSGSMEPVAEATREFCRKHAHARIILYNKRNGIRLVATDGKVARDPSTFEQWGGGNGVDGPALDWLGLQPGKRFWVSDGGVGGINGSTTAHYKDCANKVRAYGIVQVQSLDEVKF
jgi:hypothetical protein